MSDYAELLHIATGCVEEAAELFRSGVGAGPALDKGRGDFATEVDLAIETLLRQTLKQRTGIDVVGEELGGDTSNTMWVVDPIDGTSNYSAGNPMSAILLALVADGQPRVAITAMPLTGQHFATCEGMPLEHSAHGLGQGHVGFSTITSKTSSPVPQAMRLNMLGDLACTRYRPRITGSVGVDLAYAAAGVFAAGVSLSPNIWDNAAGVALGRAANCTVTDIWGNPWELGAVGAVIGEPEAHRTIMKIMRSRMDKEAEWLSQSE
ncbi:inositol monophosphatase family protein [Corynebacterium pseudopelargi]|uniref:Inositol-1-monophosphatase ImpA n=1 Tax=Corynebacterium pseudopelargi TaxID=2080757 RepID=A0A3G6ITT4_9CORY|nr:inositol monophosphatase [Corynebacterium pseudopelargi]AZA08967.1 Inositol-1-monophosphatase ImpA [Corynebacterium pseudopelargi]